MTTKIQYTALDVDDKAFNGCMITEGQSEGIPFKSKPSVGDLIKKMNQYKDKDTKLKICYEATYLGYSLQRDLSKKGFDCDIIASSLIP